MQNFDWKRFLLNSLRSLAIPVGMFVLFAVLSGGRTASTQMFMTTLRQSVTPICICWGLILNMSVGMINFSAGGMILTAGILGANFAKSTGTGALGMVFFTMAIALALGAITGLLYNALRVPAIVLTIGTMLIWESLPKLFYSSGVIILPDMSLLARAPYVYIIFFIMLVVFYLLYNKTVFGHNLRAVGNNQAIANNVGVNSDKIKFMSYLYGALFIGVSAFLYVSERGEVRNMPAMGSMAIMMDGFMGVFIALFLSKYCNMSIAVVLGAFSMKMLSNGFVAIGLSATVRSIVQGLFLLVLLVISANSGLMERRKADKTFAKAANEEYHRPIQA